MISKSSRAQRNVEYIYYFKKNLYIYYETYSEVPVWDPYRMTIWDKSFDIIKKHKNKNFLRIKKK
jgi:hypothetical protein